MKRRARQARNQMFESGHIQLLISRGSTGLRPTNVDSIRVLSFSCSFMPLFCHSLNSSKHRSWPLRTHFKLWSSLLPHNERGVDKVFILVFILAVLITNVSYAQESHCTRLPAATTAVSSYQQLQLQLQPQPQQHSRRLDTPEIKRDDEDDNGDNDVNDEDEEDEIEKPREFYPDII